ncbi:hypothetical protein GONAM_61_00110 [Gordonia namibiensis NBRC 108229]|uniref:Uncharacterized protein n=1 Tax=Gordonia namibiensis NBRC 108229 TaxID=1208314 RepID=K6XV77_9ACTN|nr:hypothetical protein GONAM_61_00110 [Gordonia namibiensis NBRC 108229]
MVAGLTSIRVGLATLGRRYSAGEGSQRGLAMLGRRHSAGEGAQRGLAALGRRYSATGSPCTW